MILLLLTLSCPPTEFYNHTTTWTSRDQKTYDNAQRRCSELYKDAPCVKRFTKVDDNTYRVICSNK